MSQTLVAIGRRQRERGEYEKAIKTFRRAVSFNIKNSDAEHELLNTQEAEMKKTDQSSNKRKERTKSESVDDESR